MQFSKFFRDVKLIILRIKHIKWPSYCWQTVYFFDVQSTYLREALERFAEFFIEPLFNEDYMANELDIVDRG